MSCSWATSRCPRLANDDDWHVTQAAPKTFFASIACFIIPFSALVCFITPSTCANTYVMYTYCTGLLVYTTIPSLSHYRHPLTITRVTVYIK